MNCWSFASKAVLCEYKFDNKQDCRCVLCGTSFTTSSIIVLLISHLSLFFVRTSQTKISLLQVCQEAKAVLCEHKLNNKHVTDFKYLQCNVGRTHKHMHWKKKAFIQHWGSPTCRCRTLSVEPGGSVFPGRPARQGGQVPPLLDHHHFCLHIHILHNHRQYIW